jgi:hypothetical protein
MTRQIRLGSRRITLPQSRFGRIGLGLGLVAGGVFSFLPVLGIWMLPLGLIVLSVDFPRVRRVRRLSEVRIWRWWRGGRAVRPAGTGSPAA